MPGPFTHIYTARRIADFLKSSAVTDEFIRPSDGKLLKDQQLVPELLAQLGRQKCADAMNKWEKFTAVGAIGPDLFFWLQDYNDNRIPCDEIMLAMNLLYYLDDQKLLDNPYDGLISILELVIGDAWASILRFIVKLDKIWQKFLEKWNQFIGPILDLAGQAIDDLSGQLFSSLGDAITELKNAILFLAGEELLTKGDIFGWFSLKMRKGYDEQAFVWSDMTHYRRTTVVPAQLIVHARDMLKKDDKLTKEHGEQLLAFALGWICHVGTDVIEHSFVNEQCGGPFRTHWQRHHLIENHIDAWNYQCTGNGTLQSDPFVGWQPTYPSVGDSALYFAVQIPQDIDNLPDAQKQGDLRKPLPQGDDRNSIADRKKLLDTDGALPLWLAETVVQVFIDVYADPSEGGDQKLQDSLAEGPSPHPRNLAGQQFQDDLKTGTDLLGKWLGKFGVDNAGIALDELRKIVTPDLPAGMDKVPEGFPLPWELQAAYRFMLSWFKRSYVGTFNLDRPEPPKVFIPPASDIPIPGPPDFSGVNPNDDPISQVCEAILAVLDWVWKSLEKTAQFLYDIVKTAISAATWPAREILYETVTLPLWEASENIRMVLVHLGYMMPASESRYESGNLKRPNEIDLELIKLGHTVDSAFKDALAAAFDPLGNLDKDPSLLNIDVRNVLGAPNPWLPIRVPTGETEPGIFSPAGNDVAEYQRPWGFPDKNNSKNPAHAGNYLETPLTTAGPYKTDTMPNQLLTLTEPASNTARTLYQGAGCPHDTDIYTDAFVLHKTEIIEGSGRFGEGLFPGTNPLGDPVVFSAYLIGQIACNDKFLSSFNLDADRGYGYLCWDWDRVHPPPGVEKTDPKDGRGRPFPAPVTWPEGSDKWVPPDPAPVSANGNLYKTELKLHYPGRKCKETEGGGDNGGGGGSDVPK
ncbi:hypothetical protein MMC30_000252 [Trapelia coarctata]|nr:hypothetical protein [Trapelia coarctata]